MVETGSRAYRPPKLLCPADNLRRSRKTFPDRGRKSAEEISRKVRKVRKETIDNRFAAAASKILFRSQKPQPCWIAAVSAAEDIFNTKNTNFTKQTKNYFYLKKSLTHLYTTI